MPEIEWEPDGDGAKTSLWGVECVVYRVTATTFGCYAILNGLHERGAYRADGRRRTAGNAKRRALELGREVADHQAIFMRWASRAIDRELGEEPPA